MKTIGVSKNIRTLIRANAREGESVNDTLTRLLNDVDDIIPYEEHQITNIAISEENFERMKELKAEKESYNSLIQRMIFSEKGKTV